MRIGPVEEYLVHARLSRRHVPLDLWDRLLGEERERGRELIADGSISHIWRLPGTYGNVGIWSATTATHLHQNLSSLPLFPWMQLTVTPLAHHPLSDQPGID